MGNEKDVMLLTLSNDSSWLTVGSETRLFFVLHDVENTDCCVSTLCHMRESEEEGWGMPGESGDV